MERLVNLYQRFLLENLEVINSLENGLRTIIFFMPGRFRHSALKLEVAYTTLGYLSLWHDLLTLHWLQKLPASRLKRDLVLPPSSCTKLATCITAVEHTELLIEIFAKQKWGNDGKWKAVFAVELLKAILKIALVIQNGGKMVTSIHATIPSYRDDSQAFKDLVNSKFWASEKPRRSRISVSKTKLAEFQMQAKDENTVTSSPGNKLVGEMLHIVRPLVYILAILKFGQSSWRAWLASLIMDFIALSYYIRRALWLSDNEKSELLRRMGLLFFYFLRSPMYEALTQKSPNFLKAIVKKSKRAPGIGLLLEPVLEYLNVYRENYFYISGT